MKAFILRYTFKSRQTPTVTTLVTILEVADRIDHCFRSADYFRKNFPNSKYEALMPDLPIEIATSEAEGTMRVITHVEICGDYLKHDDSK
ncbi:MAG: hypothetical protein RLY57_205 [Candidatus Parcubacteria bacterium]|jgi:hypothetical protein